LRTFDAEQKQKTRGPITKRHTEQIFDKQAAHVFEQWSRRKNAYGLLSTKDRPGEYCKPYVNSLAL